MQIKKIRLGFANNSSSTHSIVFFDEPSKIEEDIDDGYFGWENFTLKSKEKKTNYFSSMLYESLRRETNEINALIILESFFEDGYELQEIDHQSLFLFPTDFSGSINLEFLKEFYEFYKKENVVVLGGNDNDDGHPLKDSATYDLDLNLKTESPVIAKKNISSNSWTLFNCESGAKLSVSFSKNNLHANLDRVDYPELVDLKISDYCPYGCSYCYMGSTKSGRHASFDDIKKYVDILSEWGVFEIALGGGEPTLHPNFKEILAYIRSKNIVPNFTTRNLPFISRNSELIKNYCGSLAISVDNAEDLLRCQNFLFNTRLERKISFQYVMGINPLSDLNDVAEYCLYRDLILLGYKSVGRGKEVTPHPYDGWIDILKNKKSYNKIKIDTALAENSKEELKDENISTKFYYTEEGKFSMYIDAVEAKFGKSSYHETFEIENKESMLEKFRTF